MRGQCRFQHALAASLNSAGPGAAGKNRTEEILRRAGAYYDSGDLPNLSPDEVYQGSFASGGDRDLLIDVRERAAYDVAHIKGAISVPFREWGTAASLAKLPLPERGSEDAHRPRSHRIVVISYTGLQASLVMMLLRLLGYEAYTSKFGMMGWTTDAAKVGAITFCQGAENNEFPTVTEPSEAEGRSPLPRVDAEGEVEHVILAAARATFESVDAVAVLPSALHDGVEEGAFLLDVRDDVNDGYARGHIAGAVHIPYKELILPENLRKLPRDRRLVLICHTGHKAGLTALLLRVLGYDAVVLAYGMMGWTADTDIIGATGVATCDSDYPTAFSN